MAQRSVVLLTTGVAGSGKSYVRCARFLVDEFLPESQGVHYSNFPIFADVVAEHVGKRLGVAAEEIRRRIKTIPDEVQHTWIGGHSGPWDYFADTDLQDAHIAIDEIHNFCGKNSKRKMRARWQAWLGEIRHRGATVEFISQSPQKIAREIEYEAGVRLSLINSSDRRDPFFGIVLGDWYELRAGLLTGELQPRVWQVERRNVDGKWLIQSQKTFVIEAEYFKFYDSYSAPHMGGRKANAPKYEFQKRTRTGLCCWFTRRNWWPLFSRVAGFALFIAFFFGGLGNYAFSGFLKLFGSMYHATAAREAARRKAPGRPAVMSAEMSAFADLLDSKTPRSSQKVELSRSRARVQEQTGTGDFQVVDVPSGGIDTRISTGPNGTGLKPNGDMQAFGKSLESEKSQKPIRISAVWSCCITLTDGRRISKGTVADGVLIEAIDFEHRRVKLSDGRNVGVGDEWTVAAGSSNGSAAAIGVWSAAE